MANILQQIESKYPVETILVNGEQAWPYLRIRYHFAYTAQAVGSYGEAKAVLQTPHASRPLRILRFMRNIMRGMRYGFTDWFRRYDYIALTGSRVGRHVRGRWMDPFIHPVADEIGARRVLCIETTFPFPSYVMNQDDSRHTVSSSLLVLSDLIIRVMRRVFRSRCQVANGEVLARIAADLGLNVDFAALVETYQVQRKTFTWLFRVVRPRAILLTASYGGRQAAIRAAKGLGIKVVEMQHGVIGKEHPGYNLERGFDRAFSPDHLLVFGRRELATFDDCRFMDRANVHPVGSYLIDLFRAERKLDPQLLERLSGYRMVVGVTLQWTSENRLIAFMREAAQLDPDIFYMLIPREPEKQEYADMVLPENVAVIRDKNFYELMAYCDFHTTVNSTCALEAPSLGVQNILVDLEGSARRYYGRVLNDDRVTRFADSPAEYIDIIRAFARLDRDAVCKLHEGFFAPNYRENIRNFVKKYLP